MLQIVIALSAASPIVLKHRMAVVLRLWVGTIFRLALALIAAATAYFGVILLLVKAYPVGHPFTLPVYGAGFAVATLAAVIAATLVSPARLSRIITHIVCGLATLFPIGLYVHFGTAGEWRVIYLMYLAGSITGIWIVARLTSWAGATPRLSHV